MYWEKGWLRQRVKDCREQFLREIIENLVPAGKHIACLGREAFQNVKELVEQHNRWKVIGVHHPTGSRMFANYFVKERKKLTDRPLKDRVKEDFRKLEEQAAYLHWFEPS